MSNGFKQQPALSGLDPLDDGEGPAARISPERARALVRSVVMQGGGLSAARAKWPRWARASAIVLAAAAATSAAAAYRGGWSPWPFAQEEPESAPAAPAPRPVSRVPRTATRDAPAAPTIAAASEVMSPSDPAPAPPATERAARRRLDAPSRGSAQRAAPAKNAAPATIAPAEPPPPEPSAAVTLAQANAARGARRYSEALSLYSRVIDDHPGSAQAQAARVAAADLALEHSRDPERSQRLYEEAVRGGGELAAEARFGIAQSRRARGDRAGERAALDEFLRRHPGHTLARVARQRREELAR